MSSLVLPRRYERLEQAALTSQKDVSRIVVRVDAGLAHLQRTFAAMHQGDVGGLDIYYGASGAGKTTFLATSSRFLDGLAVHRIENSTPLVRVVSVMDEVVRRNPGSKHLFYLHDRENQRDADEDIIRLMDDLRREFRRFGPTTLLVWPISREDYATHLVSLANRTGADSLLPNGPKFFHFLGPLQQDYFSIANETCKLFNSGQSLAEFGLSEAHGRRLATEHDTIAAYFAALATKSGEIEAYAADVLSQRPRPRVWILVAGDDAKELWGYVRSLTYGNQRALDIPAFTLALGEDRENAQYRKQWQVLGDAMPYILSYLDIRIIEVAPRLALAIARAFGDASVTSLLQSPAGDQDAALNLLRESVLGELLTGSAPVSRSAPKKTEPSAAEEYNRVQALAQKKRDGELHAAFAEAVKQLLKDGADVASVTVGKRVDALGLNPDVYVAFAKGDPVCLEFTWRTSKPQKTYTPGHIQQYVLNKVFDYVSALGLEKLVEKIATK